MFVEDQNSQSEVLTAKKEKIIVGQSARKIHLVDSSENRKNWELWAEKAYELTNKNLWKFDGVKVRFFSRKGQVFEVTGEKGTFHAKSQNIDVSKNVFVTSENGYEFSTTKVKYNSKKESLVASEAVRMKGPKSEKGHRMFLTGERMEATLKDGLMKVFGNVKAEKRLNDQYNIYISSEKVTFSGERSMADFRQNVIVNVEDIYITGPHISFEYDSQSGDIKTVLGSGGVKVSGVDKWATAKNLKIILDKKQFIFTGKPKLIQKNDEMQGEKIIFSDGGRKIRVYKGKIKIEKNSLLDEK